MHATAGFCDPGWKGTLTLELNNLTRVPIILHPGLLIAQLSFMTLDAPAAAAVRVGGARIPLPGPGGGDGEPLRRPALGPVAFRAVLHALITFAATEEGEESSKTLFYVCGGAARGVGRRRLGDRDPGARDVPALAAPARGVMAISVVLILSAMASAVITG